LDDSNHTVTTSNKDSKEHVDFFNEHTSFDQSSAQKIVLDAGSSLIHEPKIEDKSKRA
jgi:hypothetical protein